MVKGVGGSSFCGNMVAVVNASVEERKPLEEKLQLRYLLHVADLSLICLCIHTPACCGSLSCLLHSCSAGIRCVTLHCYCFFQGTGE